MNIIQRYWRIIFPLLFVLVIWILSSHNGDKSKDESGALALFLGMSEAYLRKLAHFVLFGGLGFSLTSFIKGLHPRTFPMHTQVFYPVVFTTIYGALDEVHQLTVSGRNGSASDVFLDAFAGCAGVFLYIAFFCFYRLWRAKRTAAREAAEIAKETEE